MEGNSIFSDQNSPVPVTLRFKSFLGAFAVVVAFGGSALAVFAVLVDSYAIFDSPIVKGYNNAKNVPDHITKPYAALRERCDTLILGSSRVKDIFCADVAAVYAGQTVRCFNGGVAHANFDIARRMLRHASSVRPIKRIIIGLDFFGFNVGFTPFSPSDNERFLGADNKLPGAIINDLFRLTLSRAALAHSLETVQKSGMSMRDNAEAAKPAPVENATPASSKATKAVLRNQYVDFYPGVLHFYSHFAFQNARTGESSLNSFRNFLLFCRAKGIETHIFINPPHAILLEVFREEGLWDTYLLWKRRLVEIVAEVNEIFPGSAFTLWDFSGYNTVTTEPVVVGEELQRSLTYYADPFHYHRNVGMLMLRRMIRGEETVSGFGRVLALDNLESDRVEQERARERFVSENAAYIDMLFKKRGPR